MTQLYHDKITDLFDEYYSAEKGAKPAPNKRIESADALIEDYIEQHGKRPPASVLSRLATYVLLDTLTDSHPDKMSREEYPIMSYAQVGRYFERNTSLAGVEYDSADVRGTIRSSATGAKDVLLAPNNEDINELEWRVFLRQILNDREYFVIESLYDEGMTQAETAEKIGVSERWVRKLLADSLDKLRETTSYF